MAESTRTLILVKPDAFARGLTGEVLARFERKGLRIVALRQLHIDQAFAGRHYAEHAEKPFFGELVEFITGGTLVAMVLEGTEAVPAARQLIGATNPVEAAPGSIRGDYALEVTFNMVHGSDSDESAEREISIWFPELGLWRGWGWGSSLNFFGGGDAAVRDRVAEKVQDVPTPTPTPTPTQAMTSSVVLASGSPQRRELLEKLGVEFEVVVPGVEELSGGDPEVEVLENARRKANAARAGGGVGGTSPEEALATAGGGGSPAPTGPARLVIACDTDVVLDGKALGKPADEREAREYLDRMSGRAHEVLSGLVVIAGGEERSGLERTTVVFRRLSGGEKERYVRFGEWRGRSGGYAIQTLGSTLVERLEGSVSNVVGLPVGLLAELAPELLAGGSAA